MSSAYLDDVFELFTLWSQWTFQNFQTRYETSMDL